MASAPVGARARLGVWDVIGVVTDGSDLEVWDAEVVSDDPLGFSDKVPYRERLEKAQRETGLSESVVTGRARVAATEHEVVIVAGAFEFMAGTMNVAAAERVVRAFDRARELRLPVVGLPISGGTRMQEGTLGFVQMANCAAAVRRFRDAGLPYVAWLRHPTTGGVLASWGSLATVTFAEPDALIGMTGPRVVQTLNGEPFPAGVQTAENLHVHGLVDGIVTLEDLPERLARVLAVTTSRPTPWPVDAPADDDLPHEEPDAWRVIEQSRRVERPGLRELLDLCATDVTHLRGDGAGQDDAGCVLALARICGIPAVVVGHDRPAGERGARLDAAGYRKARRGMELAEHLGLPLVTMIDTPGAELTPRAEEGGLAQEIARCLATMTGLAVPTLSVLLGEGAGGGAIAFLPADRVVAVEHSWLAPIVPEGASAILYRTPDRAADLAAAQATSAMALRHFGIVDVVVTGPAGNGGAQDSAGRIAATIARELTGLVDSDAQERRRTRARRYLPGAGPGAVLIDRGAGHRSPRRVERNPAW